MDEEETKQTLNSKFLNFIRRFALLYLAGLICIFVSLNIVMFILFLLNYDDDSHYMSNIYAMVVLIWPTLGGGNETPKLIKYTIFIFVIFIVSVIRVHDLKKRFMLLFLILSTIYFSAVFYRVKTVGLRNIPPVQEFQGYDAEAFHQKHFGKN